MKKENFILLILIFLIVPVFLYSNHTQAFAGNTPSSSPTTILDEDGSPMVTDKDGNSHSVDGNARPEDPNTKVYSNDKDGNVYTEENPDTSTYIEDGVVDPEGSEETVAPNGQQ